MDAFVVSLLPCAFHGAPLRAASPCRKPHTHRYAMTADRAVVWIRRGDRRTVDHPGLDAARGSAAATALSFSRDEADVGVNAALEAALRKRGLPLSVTVDENEPKAVTAFAKRFGATAVHVRLDETEESRAMVGELARLVPSGVAVRTWQDEYRTWGNERMTDIPYEYPKYQQWMKKKSLPFQAVAAEDTVQLLSENNAAPSLRHANELGVLEKKNTRQYDEFLKRYAADSALSNTLTVEARNRDVDEYGELVVRKYLEAADRYENPDMARSLAPVLSEGLVSARRIREIVEAHESENGRIWRFAYREGAKQLLNYLDSREFAQLLARRDLATTATVDGEHMARFWRWQGLLVRYVAEGPVSDKPPLLLVHGFGASSQHMARSVQLLKKNYRVYAIDLVGYGRSEKAPTAFTPDLTEKVLYDFVREVVQRPVYVAGNSIGGYFSASFAADAYPELCAGVCLLNSAGKLEPSPEEAAKAVAPSRGFSPLSGIFGLGKSVLESWKPARMVAANILLNNLRGRIQKTLVMVYPTNPECADEALAKEIYRNSLDFGADEVLASGLVLPTPRSLSELLRKYEGPLLVYQGTLDPLNSSTDRAEKIKAEYPAATIEKRQLGHCPHDEDAPDFSKTISRWMDTHNEKMGVRVEDAVEVKEEVTVRV